MSLSSKEGADSKIRKIWIGRWQVQNSSSARLFTGVSLLKSVLTLVIGMSVDIKSIYVRDLLVGCTIGWYVRI